MVQRGYSVAVLASVGLHGLLVLLLVAGWTPENERRQIKKPRVIEAQLLQMEPAVTQPAPPKEDNAARQRAEQQEREARAQREQERREARRRKEEQARQAAEERKRREEAARRERERQEQLEREREAERRRQEELRRKQKAEELARAMAREEQAVEAARNQERIGSYKGYIVSQIEANWSRPPSARRDMEVVLEIQLVPTGRVVGVNVVESSGNPSFDRSAEQAVLKVGQFDRLQGMEPALFEQNFRTLRLLFRPEDLRL